MKKKVFLFLSVFFGLVSLMSCKGLMSDNEKNDDSDIVVNTNQYYTNYGVSTCSYSHEELFVFAKKNTSVSEIGWACKMYLYTMCPDLVYYSNSKNVVGKMWWEASDNDDGSFSCEQDSNCTEITFEKGKLYYIKQTGSSTFNDSEISPTIAEFMNTTSNSLRYKGFFKDVYNVEMIDDSSVYEYSNEMVAIADEFTSAMTNGEINEFVKNSSEEVDEYFCHFAVFVPLQTFEVSLKLNSTTSTSYKDYGLEISAYGLIDYSDNVAPNFTNNDYYIPVSVDSPLTSTGILSKITAVDETDGDVSSRVELVSTTYDYNAIIDNDIDQLKTHDFVVKVDDLSGNEKTATFYVRVYDIVKPTLSGESTIKISYDEDKLDTDDVIDEYLTYEDNYSPVENIDIVLKSNNYSSSYNVVGSYSLIYYATDYSGNNSEDFTITINVVDEKAPIIVAPTTIECNNSCLLLRDEITSKISVSDGYDGNINYTLTGYDNYKNSYSFVGNYELTISAKDSSGNNSTHIITLNNTDKIAPDFFVPKDFVIVVGKGEELTNDMILEFLAKIGEISLANVNFMECNYIDESGEYEVKIFMKDDSIYCANILVNDNYDDEEEETGNWWTRMWNKVGNWFKETWNKLFNSITNWVKSLFEKEDLTDDEEKEDGIVENNPEKTSEENIIDNQFVVYELEPVDPDAGVPATMPNDFNMPMLG